MYIHAQMATKTISVDLEAYERLRSARRAPDESFSKVIKRAQWVDDPRDGAGLLAALAAMEPVSSDVLEYLDDAQLADNPPRDAWQRG